MSQLSFFLLTPVVLLPILSSCLMNNFRFYIYIASTHSCVLQIEFCSTLSFYKFSSFSTKFLRIKIYIIYIHNYTNTPLLNLSSFSSFLSTFSSFLSNGIKFSNSVFPSNWYTTQTCLSLENLTFKTLQSIYYYLLFH
jgi:hypothetical protein